jgi:hypothetical protein
MSVGNLKSYGNRSNNFPYQLKVLEGLQCICDTISANTNQIEDYLKEISNELTQLVNGTARTPGIIRPTGSGNVNSLASEFFSVSVANVGSANGTVLGTTIKPGEVLNFSADSVNNYFTSFAYNATGTEFVIIYVA